MSPSPSLLLHIACPSWESLSKLASVVVLCRRVPEGEHTGRICCVYLDFKCAVLSGHGLNSLDGELSLNSILVLTQLCSTHIVYAHIIWCIPSPWVMWGVTVRCTYVVYQQLEPTCESPWGRITFIVIFPINHEQLLQLSSSVLAIQW